MGAKTKRKKGRQKSKAAQVTAAKRAERAAAEGTGDGGGSESVEYTGGGGMMTRMRGGFQSAVGVGEQKKKGGVLGTILWIALIAAAVFFVMGEYQ